MISQKWEQGFVGKGVFVIEIIRSGKNVKMVES